MAAATVPTTAPAAVFAILFGVRALERECYIDNLLVRIHFIIVMIRWTTAPAAVFAILLRGVGFRQRVLY